MSDNYEWLTVDEAVEELKAGREVVEHFRSGDGYDLTELWDNLDTVQEFLDLVDIGSKFRKPLTPEQIIASGTPLLAVFKDIPNKSIRPASPLILWSVVKSGKNIKFETQLGGVVFGKHIKFVTDKNGNYLTIKDGVAEEVLR